MRATTAKVTKILCPACEGSGDTLLPSLRCDWCRGSGRMPVSNVERWADREEWVASGAFVVDGGPFEDLEASLRKIALARKLANGGEEVT